MDVVDETTRARLPRVTFRFVRDRVTHNNDTLEKAQSETVCWAKKAGGVRTQAFQVCKKGKRSQVTSSTKTVKPTRRRGKYRMLSTDDTARVLQSCRYDEMPDETFSVSTRMPSVDQIDPKERVVVQDDSDSDSDCAHTVAKLMCVETSADDPACQPDVSQRWITSAKRYINGITSRARSMRGNSDTPESMHRLLTEQEQQDVEAGVDVPRARLLPPHVEEERREEERVEAIERDVANGEEAEMPELRAVSERYAIGFMKHLEVGRNIDIGPNGKYTFRTVESALPAQLKQDKMCKDSSASSTSNATASDKDTPIPDNIPVLAQISHQTTKRDANNSFQRAIADSAATLACKQSVYERLMNIDPRSTAGIARQSPLMKPFSNVLNITPQPFLYTAATDDIRDGMYAEQERPHVHVDGDSVNQRGYDPSNARHVEDEILNAYSHQDYYPIVPRISFELEQRFLREPFAGEPRCIMEEKCAGMTDLRDEVQPIVLVAFYPLSEIVEEFIESNRAAYARYNSQQQRDSISHEYEDAVRTRQEAEARAGHSLVAQNMTTVSGKRVFKRTKCVLCHRAFANKFAMHLAALNATSPKDYAFVQYCNIVDTYGEYEKAACIFNPSTRYRGLPGPVAVHNKHMYRQITVQSNGETVVGLEQLHPRVGMDTTIHF